MTDMIDHGPRNARALLAAQFALGLLERSERETAIRLYESDQAFAAMVAHFEHGLALEAGSSPPPTVGEIALWQRIERSIGGRTEVVPPAPFAANDNLPRAKPMLRMAALAALVSIATFAFMWIAAPGLMVRTGPTITRAPDLQAVSIARVGTDDNPIVALAYDRRSGKLLARYLAPAKQGVVPELWLIGADGKPHSLGFAHPGAAIVIVIPPELRDKLIDGSTIAISLEEPSQTRHEKPAGPILGAAKVSAI